MLTTTLRHGHAGANPATRVDERSPTSTARRTSPSVRRWPTTPTAGRSRARLRGRGPLRRRQRRRRGLPRSGPPRQVGGVNQAAGSSGRLVEQTPLVRTTRRGTTATSSTSSANTDRRRRASTTRSTRRSSTTASACSGTSPASRSCAADVLRSSGASGASRRSSSPCLPRPQATGQTATVTVTRATATATPIPARAVRYAIAGANPGAGAVTTGADGTAAITWTGANAGTDTLTAFTDINGNGVRDADEPQQAATVTGPAPPPPPPAAGAGQVRGREGGLGPGVHQVPARLRAARAATGPPKGFVPFTGARQHPGRLAAGHEQGPRRADVGGRHGRREDADVGLLPGHLPGQADGAEEEAQEADGADHRPGDEGSDLAVAVRAAEGRAVRGGRCQEEEGAEVGARQAVGQRQGQVPHERASTARRRCAGRSGWSRIAARGR